MARLAKGIGPVSRDGEAALLVLAIDAEDRGAVVEGVGQIRRYLRAHEQPGSTPTSPGPAGSPPTSRRSPPTPAAPCSSPPSASSSSCCSLVYRAPILALLPLLVVGLAYLVAIGIAYLLIEAGWITVNAEGTMLLLVLVFGAGTDYSLLLVHRYREELAQRIVRASVAALHRIRESRGAILATGGTVIAAMLVLLVADLESTHWLGPGAGDRDRGDARRLLHPAAGAARDPRRPSFLARQPRRVAVRRVPGGTSQFVTEGTPCSAPQYLGAGCGPGPAALRPDHRRRPGPAGGPLPSAT